MDLSGLDIAFFSAALINLTSAVMLAGIAPATPLRSTLLIYSCGLALAGVSLITVTLRVPLGLSGQDWLITNATTVLAAVCLVVAVHRLFDRTPPYLAISLVAATAIALLTIFDGDVDKRPIRHLLTIGTLMVSMFWRAGLAIAYHRRAERVPALAMAGFLTINGCMMAMAIVWAMLGQPDNPAVGVAAIVGTAMSVPVIVTLLVIVNYRAQAMLRQLADTDSLTSALTRRAFFERCEAPPDGAWVAMIDLDAFKQVNDQHGHLAGDAALMASVQALRARIDASMLLGRFGGEEFVLLVPPMTDPASYLESLRLAANAAASSAIGRPVTVSIGYARHRSRDPIDATIARADKALYQAKTLGRNRVVAAV